MDSIAHFVLSTQSLVGHHTKSPLCQNKFLHMKAKPPRLRIHMITASGYRSP
jgi:hypothetical protein